MIRGMIDWQGLAQRKYDIMQQQADASTTRARASRTQAQTAASLAPSTIAGNEADAAVNRARAAGMPDLINSEIGLNNANAGLVGANTTGQRIQNTAMSTQPSPETMEALSILSGQPTFTSFLRRLTFRPERSSVALPSSTADQPRKPQVSGGFSTIEDDNGIRVRRGQGFL